MTDSTDHTIEVLSPHDEHNAIVAISGEIDLSNAHDIKTVVLATAAQAAVRHVTVDLSGVSFLDSSGISALVSCQRHLMADDVGFEIVGAHGAPRRVLELTNVLDALTARPVDATTDT